MPPPAEGLASRLFLGPALRTQPDRRLVTLVREGYESAFEEIVRRYGRPLGRYAASIVGGRPEDVLQDAFAKALPALRRDDAEIDLRPWLFRIVRNTALNELRDSPPSAEALAEALAGGRSPAEVLECREELADLIRRLRALPEPQRAAIVMRELEGLSHEEIAAALGLTGGGARQAIYRARQALRDGAGMLIPLPLLQALLADNSSCVAETAGLGAAGIGGGGAGVALKATAATVLVAGAVGAGVALKDSSQGVEAKAESTRMARDAPDSAAAPALAARVIGDGDAPRQGETSGSDSRQAPRAGEDRHGPSGDRGHGDDEPAGSDATSDGGRSPGDGERRDPSPSRSSGRDSDDPDHAGRDGEGSGSGPSTDRSGSENGGSSLESGEDFHGDPGSGAEPEESIVSDGESTGSGDSGDLGGSGGGGDDGSGDAGGLSRDLPEGGGLTE